MATDNTNITQTGNDSGHQQDVGLEVIQLAENTPPSGGQGNQGNAAPTAQAQGQPPIPGVPNGEVHVAAGTGQTVIRVQVAPGETIDLPFDGELAAKFGQQGNLAIKHGDLTIILLGYAQSNQEAGVTIKDDKGQTIDIASTVAQTDPNLDIQTAAGPAAGPAANAGGHIGQDFGAGSGLGGFGELGVINPTELQYQLIQPDEKLLVVTQEVHTPPSFTVSGDTVVNEDDLGSNRDISSEAFIIGGSDGASSGLQDQVNGSNLFTFVFFGTPYNQTPGNDPFDTNDHENGSQIPGLSDNNNGIDQDKEPLSVTAHITANLNGNVPGTLTFDHAGDTPIIDALEPLGLTSHGNTLQYALLPATATHGESIVAYYTVGEGEESAQVIVFSLEVQQASSTGGFDITYTIYGPLDNAPHGLFDTGAQGSGVAGEDIFNLDTTFFVTDSTNSTTESTPGTLVFQTVDDVPQFGHFEFEYMPNGQLESYSFVPVQYDPANLTIGLDETAGQQSTHYTIEHPDTSTGQVADQNTDDAFWLLTDKGGSIQWEPASLQATNDVLHDSFASDPLNVLSKIDPSYFNNAGDHSQGFNSYIDTAQTFINVSFGADGRAEGNIQAGQTAFDGDGTANATAFQLYMTSNHQTLDHGGTLTDAIDTNLTIGDGLKVTAYQVDADTIIGIAYPPQVEGDAITNFAAVQGNGIPVFTLHIDPETGALTLTEYHQINNPLGGDATNDTYANDAIQLLDSLGEQFVFVRATDYDGDYVDGGLAVSFIDDAPSAVITTIAESGVTIDESAGLQADDQAGPAPFAYGTALAWGVSSGPVVDTSASSYGTDGPGSTVLSLHPSSAGVDSGLVDTATGQHIYLYQDGDNVVGRVGSGGVADPNGAVAIAVSIDQSGDLTTAEYRALYHNDPTSGDTSEGVSIADGALQATATVTDSDGDVATSTTDVGSHVSFLDDGPVAAITGTDTNGVTIDESAGLQADDHAGAAPFAYGTALAWGVTAQPVVDTSGTDFGADGKQSLVLALHPSSAGVDSGLVDTATGQHIYLYQDGDNVVGLVGSGGVADPNGAVAIAVSIDQSGDLTVAEYRALQHDIPTLGDTSEGVSIDPSALQVTVTATDGDGDTSQATTDVGGYVSFLDDGPTAHISAVADSGVTIDESAGVQAGTDDHAGAAPFPYGTALAWGTNGTAVVDTSATNFGVDGAKSQVLGVQPSAAGVDSGLIDTATGQHIYLYQDGANVVGKVGTAGHADPSGAIAIAVTIDQSGDLTVAEYRALVQPTGTQGDTSEGVHITDSALQVIVTATDGDGDTSTATANIGSHVTFLDDGPAAVADTNSVNSGGSVGGNVETNDSFGVDGKDAGGGVVGVATGSDTSSPVSGGLGGAGIPGSFGTLILNANGTYTYNANPNASGVDHFVYTIKDGDGDLSTVTLDITVNKVGPATDTESVTVNEAALDTTTTGNDLTHGTVTGSNPSSPDETKQGQLVLGAGVTVVGGNDQTGSFGTLHVGSDGKFTYTLTSNDHTNPPVNDGTNTINGAETFTVTIKDADGNTNTDTITINIIDDVPVVTASGATVTIQVDETPGSQVGDSTPAGILSENTGSIAGLFNAVNFGADGPAASNSLTYTLTAAGGASFGTIAGTGTDSGLKDTATGQEIYLFKVGSAIEGHVGNDPAGALAFKVSLSGTTVTLDEYRAIQHPNASDPNDTVTLNGVIHVTETATDGDGDKASVTDTNGLSLTFYDDGPTVSASGTTVTIQVDETPGSQVGDSTPAGILSENTGNIAGLFNAVNFGADGAAASNSITYSLTKAGGVSFGTTVGTGTDSGLKDTATGQEIYLFKVGSAIEGHVGNDPAGALAFKVSLSGTTVTLDEYRAIQHPNASDPNDTVTLNGVIHVTETATDGDGDKASVTDTNGLSLTFYDDGPTVSASGTTVTIQVDETPGSQVGDSTPAGILSENSGSIAGLFNAVNFGADGAAASNSITYSLTKAGGVSFGTTAGTGTDSGLKDTATGQEIFLFKVGSAIEGHVGNDPAGALAFKVSLSGTTVTLDEYRAIQHPNANDPNDTVTLNGVIHVTETATDGDGDKASVTDTNGLSLTFYDDAPTVAASGATVGISVDETPGTQLAGETTPAGILSENSGSIAGLFNAVNFGADGAAASNSITYSLTKAGGVSFGTTAGTGTDSGLKDTATGQEIYLFQNGSKVEGHVGNNPAGALAFTVSLSGSTVTLDEYRAIFHLNANDPNDVVQIAGLIHVTETATDGDGDKASVTDTNGLTLNFYDDAPSDFHPDDAFVTDQAGAKFTGSLDINGHTGVDGLGSFSFDVTNGTVVTDSVTGATLKSGGSTIYWYHVGSDVVGTTDPTGVDASKIVFEFTPNTGTNSYEFDLIKPIDNGAGLDFTALNGAPAGQSYWIGVNDPSSQSKDDLLFTGLHAGSDTVNTSSTDIGSNNQWIGDQGNDGNEGIRLDFVTGITGTDNGSNFAAANSFNFTGRYDITKFQFQVPQTKGGGTASITIKLFDALNDTNTSSSTLADFTANSSTIAVANVAVFTDANLTTHDAGVTITPNGDGTYTLTGVHAGDFIVVTGSTNFDRAEIDDATGGDAFAISHVQVLTQVTGSDVNLHLGTSITDGDGDKSTSTSGIDVTLSPTTTNLIDHHTSVADETITGTSKSDQIVLGTGNTTVDISSGGHDNVVISGDNLAAHDVITGFTDHTAVNAATEQDHVDLDAVFDKLGVTDAHRVAGDAFTLTQNGTDVVVTVAAAPNFQLTIHNETVANLNVGADNTHDIITGHL